MSLRDVRRHVGQLLFAGFDGFIVPPEVLALVREFDLGGIVLFKRNVEAPEQVAEVAAELRGLNADMPLWVGIDQEGGRVARLRSPFTEWPAMAALGRADRPVELARRFAAALASELLAVGVNIDFAPVLDVHTNAANQVIGDRALSNRADQVAELGRVIIETMQGAGLAACGKHFPGHGDTTADSHHELPVVEHDVERLRAVEFVPFRAAIGAGVSAVITAHVLVPALDEERPATLSPRIVTDLLRGELEFGGLVLTDDMDMKAISGTRTMESAAVAAIAAGCDGLLVCGPDHDRQARALEAVIRAVESGELSLKRVQDALAAQRRAKERFLHRVPGRPLAGAALRSRIGTAEHVAIAEEMARFA